MSSCQWHVSRSARVISVSDSVGGITQEYSKTDANLVILAEHLWVACKIATLAKKDGAGDSERGRENALDL